MYANAKCIIPVSNVYGSVVDAAVIIIQFKFETFCWTERTIRIQIAKNENFRRTKNKHSTSSILNLALELHPFFECMTGKFNRNVIRDINSLLPLLLLSWMQVSYICNYFKLKRLKCLYLLEFNNRMEKWWKNDISYETFRDPTVQELQRNHSSYFSVLFCSVQTRHRIHVVSIAF